MDEAGGEGFHCAGLEVDGVEEFGEEGDVVCGEGGVREGGLFGVGFEFRGCGGLRGGKMLDERYVEKGWVRYTSCSRELFNSGCGSGLYPSSSSCAAWNHPEIESLCLPSSPSPTTTSSTE